MSDTPIPVKGISKEGVLEASEKAALEPTLFNPRERATYIRDRITEIRKLKALGQSDAQVKEALGSFVKEYPTLFQKAIEPNFKESELTLMLRVMDSMANTGMSQHQASVIVGQRLMDTFITPTLKGATPK